MDEKKTKLQLECEKRGIHQLCCYLPMKSLLEMAATGFLTPALLEPVIGQRTFYDQNHQLHTKFSQYVTCWIEYPQTWLWKKKVSEQHYDFWRIFYLTHLTDEEQERYEDDQSLPTPPKPSYWEWVLLLIDPAYLWQEGTLFCPGNAIEKKGQDVRAGLGGFQQLYLDRPATDYFQKDPTRHRSKSQLAAVPTDQYAEVLIPDRIAIQNIREIVFSSTEVYEVVLQETGLGYSEQEVKKIANGMHPRRDEKRGPEHKHKLFGIPTSINLNLFADSLRHKIETGHNELIEKTYV